MEMETALPGTVYETPLGTVDSSTHTVTLNEAGKAHIAAARVRAVKNFGGHPFKDMSSAPQPEIRVGKLNFNPFTGQFTKGV